MDFDLRGRDCETGELHEYDGKALSYFSHSPYPFGFDPTFHRYRLDEPQRMKKPQTIFVCSMADMFADWVPTEWIKAIFDACKAAPQHRYIFLTKNGGRYIRLEGESIHVDGSSGLWMNSDNAWYGQTITGDGDKQVTHHKNLFLSIEPLLSRVTHFAGYIHFKWVIVGAMTGPGAKAYIPQREWIEEIVQQCRASNIPVFLKNSLADIWGEALIQEYPW